ncbi:hypothetical protein D9M71_47380 [compost metagenome]
MGTLDSLENLVRSGAIKAEPADRKECEGLMRSAGARLKDAHAQTLSNSSRFDLAYNAVHALALTALRLHGYRSDRRYLVFQCLFHTLSLDRISVRLFSHCHDRRNLAEYEGYLDENEALLAELLAHANQLQVHVEKALFEFVHA